MPVYRYFCEPIIPSKWDRDWSSPPEIFRAKNAKQAREKAKRIKERKLTLPNVEGISEERLEVGRLIRHSCGPISFSSKRSYSEFIPTRILFRWKRRG